MSDENYQLNTPRDSTGSVVNPATEEKQDDIITAIGAIPGGGGTQYTEGDTDATITGTAALVEGAGNALEPMVQPLTDTELRATPVPVSGTFYQATQPVSIAATVATDPTDDPTRDNGKIDVASLDQYTPVSGRLPVDGSGVTQPISGTVTVNALPAGTNNIGDVDVLTLPLEARTATAADATASGDTTIVSITNTPRLYYISLSANGANSADVTAIVRVGASAKYKVSLKAGSIWSRNVGAGRAYISGSAGDDIIVNLSAAQIVHVSVEYADV